MAGYRDKEFQLNQMDPYQEASATRSALIEGGIQNISSALGDTSARLGKMYEAEQMSGLYSNLFGLGAGQSAQGTVSAMNTGLMNAFNTAKMMGSSAGQGAFMMGQPGMPAGNALFSGFQGYLNRGL